MSSTVSELRPTDLRSARDLLVEAAKDGLRLGIRGGGTAQQWGAPMERVDAYVDTTGMTDLLAYNPADMTVAVGAGMRLRDLQKELDTAGQRVALDAARIPHGATVGGLLATGDGGPIRAVYGTLRDLVIGVTVVLADGTVSQSGGHVIKNVAGYDLAKLFAGSLGTFGLITEVVLRVHPLPEASGTVAVECDAPTAFERVTDLLGSTLEPVSVDWIDGRLLVRVEGTEQSVRHRLSVIATVAGGEPAEDGAWDEVADVEYGAEGDTILRAGTRPDRFPALAASLASLAEQYDVNASLTSSVGIGVHTVRLRGGTAAAHANVLQAWRSDAQCQGGSVTVHRRLEGVDELVAPWGKAPGAVHVLQAVKKELDPDGRLSPGRFAPWF